MCKLVPRFIGSITLLLAILICSTGFAAKIDTDGGGGSIIYTRKDNWVNYIATDPFGREERIFLRLERGNVGKTVAASYGGNRFAYNDSHHVQTILINGKEIVITDGFKNLGPLEATWGSNVFLSPDGNWLAYTSRKYRGEAGRDYPTYITDGTTKYQLPVMGNREWRAVAWSHDGSRIAMTNGKNIYIANQFGYDLQCLTERYGVDEIEYLSWSPDDTKIVFDTYSSKYTKKFLGIIKVNKPEAPIDQFHFNEFGAYHPSWSPDGNLIIFHTDQNELYIMDAVTGAGRSLGLQGQDPIWISKAIYNAR